MGGHQVNYCDLPTEALEVMRTQARAVIDRDGADINTRRVLLRINAALGKRNREPEIQTPWRIDKRDINVWRNI